MSKLITFIIGLFEAIRALFSRPSANGTLAPAEPSPYTRVDCRCNAAPMPLGDVEVLGLYAHYTERAPAENIPYDQINPDRYPKVWVVARGTKPGAVTFGLRVDGRMPDPDEIETDGTVVEETEQPVIVVLDYPKYTRYRAPGQHDVQVLLGHAPGDDRTVTWLRSVPFMVRTVSRDD